MFQVGDKIFYPLYGAGTVQGIEEKEILGEKEFYFILSMALRDLKVMIPVKKTANLDIRDVVKPAILENVLELFHQGEPDPSDSSYKQRQQINKDRIKSGDIFEGVEVIRDLTLLKKKKALGTDDKNMLDHAKQMLISEVILVTGMAPRQAAELLN